MYIDTYDEVEAGDRAAEAQAVVVYMSRAEAHDLARTLRGGTYTVNRTQEALLSELQFQGFGQDEEEDDGTPV